MPAPTAGLYSRVRYATFCNSTCPNLLVCRYNPVLARQLEAMGGVKYIYLTHR